MNTLKYMTFLASLSILVGCGDPSKADLLKKAEGVQTKAQLEDALGEPDDLSKVGPVEQWIYNAKDGKVVFVITGDKVAMQMTGSGG
jgi:hypothetical protein